MNSTAKRFIEGRITKDEIINDKIGNSSDKINPNFVRQKTKVDLIDDEISKNQNEMKEEDNLNIFLISHDFTHPLIDKITIIKDNNISCLE